MLEPSHDARQLEQTSLLEVVIANLPLLPFQDVQPIAGEYVGEVTLGRPLSVQALDEPSHCCLNRLNSGVGVQS